jgi:hypothetical protein
MKDVNFQDVMEYVRSMDASALTTHDFADVIQILDFVREQNVTLQDQLNALQSELDKRDAELKAREQALAIRQAAVEMVLKGKPVEKRRYLWG